MEGQDGWGRVVVRLENALHQFKGNTASAKLLFRRDYQAITGRRERTKAGSAQLA
jgi:hypothetical protein